MPYDTNSPPLRGAQWPALGTVRLRLYAAFPGIENVDEGSRP
jgi:hypothetical protein